MTKTYDSYKDSGIAWIGNIPSEWSVIKNKYLLTFLYSGGTPTASEERFYSDCGCPFVSISDMSATEYVTETKKHLTTAGIENKNLRILEAGTVLYSIYATVGAVSELTVNATISQAMLALRIINNVDKQYYKYNLKAMKNYIYSLANGNTQFNLNAEKVWNFVFCYPTQIEQKNIATFLDKKCAEIDSLISVQEEIITELQAYKQSVITEAVTKGLNPNVQMKDSGVEWIGNTPISWIIAKVKNIASITNGSDPKTEGNIPVYGSGEGSFKTCGEYKDGPTVLIGRKGATLHIPHYIEGKYWNVDTAFDVKPKKNNSLKYFYYLAICFDYKFYISATTLPSMTQTNYNNMLVPVPPLAEQQAIASYLDEKTSQIDDLIAIKQEKITELKDYKKSIIYEYVTGKKRV